MGSRDLTCVMSDLGIGYGEEVYLFLAVEGGGGRGNGEYSWIPVTYALKGKYIDYGKFELSEPLPEHILNTLKQYIKPFDEGSNPYHENAINSANLDFETIARAQDQGRLFVSSPDDKIYSGYEDEVDPLQEIMDKNNLPIRISTIGYSGCVVKHGYPDSFSREEAFALEQRLRKLPDLINSDYDFVPVGKFTSYDETPNPSVETDWHRTFLFYPKLKQTNVMFHKGYLDSPKERKMAIVAIRKDVFDMVVPITKSLIELGAAIRELLMDVKKEDDSYLSNKYYFQSRLRNVNQKASDYNRRGFHYGGEGYILGESIITDMLFSTPTERQFEFNNWVQTFDMYNILNYSMRKGFRPQTLFAGSQSWHQDIDFQANYHKKISKLLDELRFENLFFYDRENEKHIKLEGNIESFYKWIKDNLNIVVNDFDEAQKIIEEHGYELYRD